MSKMQVWPDISPQVEEERDDNVVNIIGYAYIQIRPEDPPVTVEFYRADNGAVIEEISLLLGAGDYQLSKEKLESVDPEILRMRVVTISGQATEIPLQKERFKR